MRTRIVIDPGHGGTDPGAVHGDLLEAVVVLRIAHVLKALCDTHPDVEARLTRSSNVTVTLHQRVQKADKDDAVLVSIHCNAAEDPRALGTEVWCYAQQDKDGKESLGYRIATEIQSRLVALGLHNRGARPIYDRASGKYLFRKLYVLRKTRNPAVLVECCFLSNAGDRAKLEDAHGDFHERVAVSIFEGVRAAV